MMRTELLSAALELTWQGMLSIFVVLGLIALMVKGMGWADKKNKRDQSQSAITSSRPAGPTK